MSIGQFQLAAVPHTLILSLYASMRGFPIRLLLILIFCNNVVAGKLLEPKSSSSNFENAVSNRLPGDFHTPLSPHSDVSLNRDRSRPSESILGADAYRIIKSDADTPSSRPTSIPTSQPTARSTSLPSGQPTSEPSGIPTGQPTAQPSDIPTGQPTSQPSAIPTGQPSESPTLIPTFFPNHVYSASPTIAPTVSPSLSPSDSPTVSPSVAPSIFPTLSPSVTPTSIPTPNGQLGRSWWYLYTATTSVGEDLESVDSSPSNLSEEVFIAYELVLEDTLTAAQREEVVVEVEPSTVEGSAALKAPVKSSYTVKMWCSTESSSDAIHSLLDSLEDHATPLLVALHGEGLDEVVAVEVKDVQESTTTDQPPQEGDNEPDPSGIFLIILGTVLIIGTCMCFVSMVYRAGNTDWSERCQKLSDRMTPSFRTIFSPLYGDDDDDSAHSGTGWGQRGTLRHLDIHYRDDLDDYANEEEGGKTQQHSHQKARKGSSNSSSSGGMKKQQASNPLHGSNNQKKGAASYGGYQSDDSEGFVELTLNPTSYSSSPVRPPVSSGIGNNNSPSPSRNSQGNSSKSYLPNMFGGKTKGRSKVGSELVSGLDDAEGGGFDEDKVFI